MSAPSPIPSIIYDIKAGNPQELVRHRQTDNLDKLWEWLTRYKERVSVTEILVVFVEPKVEEIPFLPIPGLTMARVDMGIPTKMLSLQRKDEASPWIETTAKPGRR